MANISYVLPTGILLFGVVSMVISCSCRPNLRADACNSDYVIVATVVREEQMKSQEESFSQYKINVTNVLKTSKQYEGADKILQAENGAPAGCDVNLETGHTYIIAGQVSESEEGGSTSRCLEVRYCNYVDLEYMVTNKELADDIIDMIENPPACDKRLAERAEKVVDHVSSYILSKNRQRNNPFQKRWGNPFQKRWGSPFQKRWGNPFQKRGRWNHPFQKKMAIKSSISKK